MPTCATLKAPHAFRQNSSDGFVGVLALRWCSEALARRVPCGSSMFVPSLPNRPSLITSCLAAGLLFACGNSTRSSDGSSGGPTASGSGGSGTGGGSQATGGSATGGSSTGGSSTGGSSTGGSSTGGNSTGGSRGDGGVGASGSGGGQAGPGGAAGAGNTTGDAECSLGEGDSESVCPDPCPIDTDATIDCDDSEFGAFGLRVGAGTETTYLATTGNALAWLGELSDGSFERRSLPEPDWTREVLQFALSPDGTPNLAISGRGGVFFATPSSDGFTIELLISFDDYGKSAIDLAMDASGKAHLAIGHGGSVGGYGWAMRTAPESWQVTSVAPATRQAWTRFTLSQDEHPVSYWYNAGQTFVQYAGVERVIDPDGARYVPVPYQVGGQGPSHAIVTQSELGLSVVWFEGDTRVEVPLPETPSWIETCVAGPTFDQSACEPATCHDDSTGVIPQGYAVDRAEDGSFWIAYVYRTRDRDLTYELVSCHPEVGCSCQEQAARDESRDLLHLVHVAVDRSVSEELSLPIGTYRRALGDGTAEVKRSIDLDIQGDSLALALTTEEHMRVLRIDLEDL